MTDTRFRVTDSPTRTVKIVYEGPGMAGKTANLDAIHRALSAPDRDAIMRLATPTDRTLFFDLLTLDHLATDGRATRLRLYTVPGQVFYNEARKLLLEGADAIVFVADSSPDRLTANAMSLRHLGANLRGLGVDLARIPGVLQVNKRDAPGALGVDHLAELLNPHLWPVFEAEAHRGLGVLETLAAAHDLALAPDDARVTCAAS